MTKNKKRSDKKKVCAHRLARRFSAGEPFYVIAIYLLCLRRYSLGDEFAYFLNTFAK